MSYVIERNTIFFLTVENSVAQVAELQLAMPESPV